MITLTSPIQVRTTLGSDVTVAYNKLVPGVMSMDPTNGQVDIPFTLTASASPSNTPISCLLRIAPDGTLTFDTTRAGVERRVVLNQAQKDSVLAIIRTAQNSFETGLINLAVVAGVQSPGV